MVNRCLRNRGTIPTGSHSLDAARSSSRTAVSAARRTCWWITSLSEIPPELVPDSFEQRLFKTGGRLTRHARHLMLHLAESYLITPTSHAIKSAYVRTMEPLPCSPPHH